MVRSVRVKKSEVMDLFANKSSGYVLDSSKFVPVSETVLKGTRRKREYCSLRCAPSTDTKSY